MLAENNGSRDINDRLEIFSHRKGHQHDHFALIILKIDTIFDSRLSLVTKVVRTILTLE